MASDTVLNPDASSSGLLGVDSGNTEELLRHVLSFIKQDVVAADLKWSLMVAASQSYTWDSSLRPFPPMFLKNGNKDLKSLLLAIEAVPSFHQLIHKRPVHQLTRNAVELLHWILIDSQDPWLSVVDKSKVDDVLGSVVSVLSAPTPKLVIKVHYNSSSASERHWLSLSQSYSSVFAFHGSKVVNFHSILHNGLQQHLTKTAMFGQGVYLSSELLMCLPYSRNGFGWAHSCIGHELSIVALCEIIDHPSVKCQKGLERDPNRATAEDSEAGELPHKMYVVPNSDLLKVRYLLIYSNSNASQAALVSKRLLRYRYGGTVIGLIARHKMAFLLLLYTLLLTSIGLSRSPMFFRLCRQIRIMLGLN